MSGELESYDYVVLGGICVLIAICVWVLFLLGGYLGVQWYVSAVAILLIGRFLIGLTESNAFGVRLENMDFLVSVIRARKS
jgi:hypothetical protein